MTTFKKILATTLYTAYVFILVIFISFGTEIAAKIEALITDIMYNSTIEDVSLSIDTEEPLMAEKTYSIKYMVTGDVFLNAGLKFESLDSEYLTVTTAGAVRASANFPGDEIQLSYKITSRYDAVFEKIVTLTFIKVYPTEFAVHYCALGLKQDSQKIYEGVPIHVRATVPEQVTYNVKTYDLLYDEEYFERTADGELLPIKCTPDGETITVAVQYANGNKRTSSPFSIVAVSDSPQEFDEIQFFANKDVGEDGAFAVMDEIGLTAYASGQRLDVALSATFADEDGGALSQTGAKIVYDTPGEKALTVSLPNGFSKTYTFKIVHITKLPTFSVELNEHGAIAMLDTEVLSYALKYDANTTYRHLEFEYNQSKLSVYEKNGKIYISPNAIGKMNFKIILDDGVQRLEQEYHVEVEQDLDFLGYDMKDFEHFLAKIMGHMVLFAGLGLMTVYLFDHISIKKGVLRVAVFLLSALAIANLTEVIQMFLPGRSSSFRDVLTDMMGFLIGSLIGYIISRLQERAQHRRENDYNYTQDFVQQHYVNGCGGRVWKGKRR